MNMYEGIRLFHFNRQVDKGAPLNETLWYIIARIEIETTHCKQNDTYHEDKVMKFKNQRDELLKTLNGRLRTHRELKFGSFSRSNDHDRYTCSRLVSQDKYPRCRKGQQGILYPWKYILISLFLYDKNELYRVSQKKRNGGFQYIASWKW